MTPEKRLQQMGIVLPPPRKPAYIYVPVVAHGGTAWISGQLPWDGEELLARGRLGEDIDVELGRRCARACIINGLSVLRAEIGSLDRVARIVKVVGFVASASAFFDQPSVVDGASDFLGDVFGDRGRHARSAIGVAALPRNVPVEVEFVAALSP